MFQLFLAMQMKLKIFKSQSSMVELSRLEGWIHRVFSCQLPGLSRTIRPVDLVRAIVHEDGLAETGLVAHPKSQEARLCLDLWLAGKLAGPAPGWRSHFSAALVDPLRPSRENGRPSAGPQGCERLSGCPSPGAATLAASTCPPHLENRSGRGGTAKAARRRNWWEKKEAKKRKSWREEKRRETLQLFTNTHKASTLSKSKLNVDIFSKSFSPD